MRFTTKPTAVRVTDSSNKSGRVEMRTKLVPKSPDATDYIFVADSSNPLSRILQYVDEMGCMIISAERGERSDEENARKTKQLENDIRQLGLGYKPSYGGYVENKNSPDERDITGEVSFIVAKPKDMLDEDFMDIAIELGNRYNQESVLVALPTMNQGKPSYIKTSGNDIGNVDMQFDKFRQSIKSGPDKDDYFTKTKRNGKQFSFYNTVTDSNLRSVSGKTYSIVTSNDVTMKDVIGYYSSVSLMRPSHPTSRFAGYDSATGFLKGVN